MPPAELRLRSPTPTTTREIAAALVPMLAPGDVVSLTGELGAGKTCLVQGLAAAMGVSRPVRSPSFLLRRDYAGHLPGDGAGGGEGVTLVHLDVYRAETLHEVLDLGLDDVDTAAPRITVVEWGDAIRPLLDEHLEVELRMPPLDTSGAVEVDADVDDHGAFAQSRELLVRGHGRPWSARVSELADATRAWHAPPCPSPADERRGGADPAGEGVAR